jgi:hypothetical protein
MIVEWNFPEALQGCCEIIVGERTIGNVAIVGQ